MSDVERIAALEQRVEDLETLFRAHGHLGNGLSSGIIVDRPVLFDGRSYEIKALAPRLSQEAAT